MSLLSLGFVYLSPRFCPERLHKSAWTQHGATHGVDITTFTHGDVWAMCQAGRVKGNDTKVQRFVLFWSEQHQNQEHLTSFKSNWTKNRLLSLACLQTSEASLFFSIFSCWFNMFPPVLITTSDLFVTEQTPNANTGWSNRDEALMRNKTFYSYFIWSHFLWRTCATRCLSILACWLMYA